MTYRPRVSLQLPNSSDPEKYYSIRLKSALENEPYSYKSADKILVVAGVEGNFQSLHRILVNNEVINKKREWIFGEGHLVLIGNCFDSVEQTPDCLWLIYSLEEKAKSKGGYVHFILGKNEIDHLHGKWRHNQPRYAHHSRSGKPLTVLYDGNQTLGYWLCTKNVIERIGDLLFVHAGISPLINNLSLSLFNINAIVRKCYVNPSQVLINDTARILFNSNDAPFRFPGYSDDLISMEELDTTLLKFEAKMIITGNIAQKRASVLYEGRVLNTAADHSMGRHQALLISKDQFFRTDRHNEKQLIWPLSQ